ncbi:MAG: UdgX family uracil-DNA binding protein [Hyphomicrobiales bacterium]|nr:UdgX family uracil-DNA binding protein [Hyphomicrobiales bacterium]
MNAHSLRSVRLDGPADVDGFLDRAARLLAAGAHPEAVAWRVAGERAEAQSDLFAGDEVRDGPLVAPAARLPAAFREIAARALLHSDATRHALAYRLAWRLRRAPQLMSIATDAEVARFAALSKSVRRDMHKMTAFVRFRRVAAPDGGEAFVAWFEPDHHIVEATAPFFKRRFANMRWSILTPRRCAHWDGATLVLSPGADKRNAPDGDALEEAWRAYYAAIFNPARLNLAAMTREMPRKYWRNLPEADLIAPLARKASARAADMVAAAPTPARRSAPAAASPSRAAAEACGSLAEISGALPGCRNCDLFRHATQVVPGEGAAHARLALVGEQPGDEEDLSGRPFVGPAGRVLNAALERVGVDRSQTFVTNAVKHFKFEPRGKKRIHKKPGAREIAACRGWLVRELELVRPRLVVALGATAAASLLGKAAPLRDLRGRTIGLANGLEMRATVHPSYLLRIEDPDAKKAGWRAFLDDLAAARELSET